MALAYADPVTENLQFLILELNQQLKRSSHYLVSNDVKAAVALIDHNDYLVNMATVVKNHCIKNITNNQSEHSVQFLRNIYDIANIFSNLSVVLVDMLRHTTKDTLQFTHDNGFTEQLFAQVVTAINKVKMAVDREEDKLGLQLADIAEQMHEDISAYEESIEQLQQKHSNENLSVSFVPVISLFTNIAIHVMHLSEAVLSLELNKAVSIRQFQALKSLFKKMGEKDLIQEASFDRIGETKSGCNIVAISTDKTQSDYFAIFKEGKKDKIKEEKEGLETWNNLFPGMAPKVISYKKKGRSAGILLEYLKGKTFEQLLLSKNRVALDLALNTLCKTMDSLWQETKNTSIQSSASYITQIKKRLPSILRVHPEYDEKRLNFGKHDVPGFRQLLEKSEEIEKDITTPFSVFIHGDLNIDNIIFDEETGQPRFIDLHRSKDTDYLQDVSVFIVSNYRIKVVDPEIQRLINRVMSGFYKCVEQFAEKNNDENFQLRLGLGLARSFITSTRFTLDEKHADDMFKRGRYLLEKIVNTPAADLRNFKLPEGFCCG